VAGYIRVGQHIERDLPVDLVRREPLVEGREERILLALDRRKVSEWSLAVVVPSFDGGTAMSQLGTCGVPSAGQAQQVYQRWTKSIATFPDWNALSLLSSSEVFSAPVGMNWSFHIPS
jgi:hypothetical protein